MDQAEILFNQVEKIVKVNANYIQRPPSMGGMWTVDTWELGDIRFQLMDEGYYSIITAPGLKVVSKVTKMIFEVGTIDDLNNLLVSITK